MCRIHYEPRPRALPQRAGDGHLRAGLWLLAATLASYLLGDSVTQFSLVIGIYLFAMGVGAWLSRFVDRGLVRVFVEVEFCVALAGGCSAPLLLIQLRLG